MAGAMQSRAADSGRHAPAIRTKSAPHCAKDPRLRTLPTLTIFPAEGGAVVYDYVSRRAMKADTDTLYWLSYFHNRTALAKAMRDHKHLDGKSLREQLLALRDAGLLTEGETPELHAQYEQQWKMGPAAAMLHFATQNMAFQTLDENLAMRQIRHAKEPSPPLYWTGLGRPVALTPQAPSPASALITLMAKRRSNRTVIAESIDVRAVMDCLQAGQAITGFVDSGTGLLPLSMTPSGGARNSFEAFVVARNVSGLSKGFYHYEAVSHRLTQLDTTRPLPEGQDLIGGQDWANAMPAIILLVAVMERITWKYQEPNAYRMLLFEAGHIGQNMLLAATAHGLSGVPTAAISHDSIRQVLGLSELSHAPVYSISLGRPGPYDTTIIPNAAMMTGLQTSAEPSTI